MKIDAKRRLLLKSTLAAAFTGVAVGAGLLNPRMVLAAWPKDAFEAKSIDTALSAALGGSATSDSGDIDINAPSIAENGAVVNVSVDAKIPNAESVSILIEKNASPLAITMTMAGSVKPFLKTRVKIGKTSDVIGVVKAGGKLYSAKKTVKVTVGGCGG